MKIAVISTSDPVNFPLGKEIAVEKFVHDSPELNIYRCWIDGKEYITQLRRSTVVSLQEILLEFFVSENIENAQMFNLAVSVKQ